MPALRFQSNDQFGAPGVYIRELAVPAPIRGALLNKVGLTGQCVRGPVGRGVLCTSYQRFLDVYGGRDYGAGGDVIGHVWRFLQKRFGHVYVVRAAAAAAVTASFTWETAAGGAGTAVLQIDASSPGVWGNDVQFKVTDASDGVAGHFNLTIRYLGKDRLYENLNINTAADDNLTLTIGNDDANWVTLTKLASGRPVNTAAGVDGADSSAFVNLGETVAAFTSVLGTEGVIADTDYTGTGKGMEILNSVKGIGLCAVAGRSNTAIKTKVLALAALANQRIWAVVPDSAATSAATAIAEAATLRDDRIIYVANYAYVIDPETGAEVVDEPHSLLFSIASQTEPDVHPAVIDNADYAKMITRVYTELTEAETDAYDAAGITFLNKDLDQSGNSVFVFGNGVMTDLTGNNRHFDGRRSKDFLISGLGFRARGDQFRPNTPNRREARKAAYEAWLTELADAEKYVQKDENGRYLFEVKVGAEVNSQVDVDAGIQIDLVRVKLIPKNLWLQLRVEVGTDVSITEQ